ncbi:MAG: DNA cytosine methyltransferase [Chlorobiaceae bacterium]
MKNDKVIAVDLFCGAGGLTHGLQKAGINVKLGVDIDEACAFPYTANNDAHFLRRSVEEINASELNSYYGERGIRLLAGCAPCQTFSTYNRKATDRDKRWWLLSHFSRLVGESCPELVTMENVPRLKEQQVFTDFMDDLKNHGYDVWYDVVNCANYGVPQLRRRLVLLASKFGPIRLFSAEEFGSGIRTVKDAIGDLPPIAAGMIDPDDPIHQASSLSDTNLKRIQASQPGGSWREWPKHLVVDCHKRDAGRTYSSVYGRMNWNMPSPTITTQFLGFGNGRFGHPEQDRAISLREGAILQSFPREYKFIAPGDCLSRKTIGRLIGNAVPVKLGEVIGASLNAHVNHY